MSQITSHILDTSLGKPAEGVSITLTQQHDDDWQLLGQGTTNSDGRVADLVNTDTVLPGGIYKLTFSLQDYYRASSQRTFYPYVDVVFEIEDGGQHYHVPLLLNPFGYSTYRGS